MLEALGLTTYENNAYTALLKLGESDAREISNQSGVPFGRIYDILSLLESKNLVQVQQSRPKRYRPVPPKQAVDRLVSMKKREFEELTQHAEVVTQELEKIYSPKDKEEDLFWQVGIGEDLIPSYIEMMDQAEKELLGYVELHPSITLGDIEYFFDVLKELLRRNIRIQILVGTKKPQDILDLLSQYDHISSRIKIRHCEPLSEPFNIIDGSKVILKVRNPAKPLEDFAFIYVWKRDFAQQLRDIYRELWRGSKIFSSSIGVSNE